MQNFRSLHDDFVVLPNAWDAGSARLFESLGAAAIATTSAGVAWARGYPDGDALPSAQLLATVREIARVIRVPLSVDIEGGYADDPSAVARLVSSVIDAGAVGINIEDGASAPELLCAKIDAARQSALAAGADLFINARTDVYLRDLAAGDAAVEEVLRRARLYQSAGSDGLFVPGLADSLTISMIAQAISPMPLNLMLAADLPAIGILRNHGVRRLSAGAAIAQAGMGFASKLASDFLADSCSGMFEIATDYGATNQLFQSVAR
jgi:2-methylisocitrate lyase-like PEP mutase family enzyme